MTNHHDDMRVAPDPSQAEELRQRLHARLASVRSADTDPDDGEGDLIMLDTEDRPTGPEARRHPSPGRWLLVAAAVAVVAVVGTVLVAVGNDDNNQLDTVAAPTTAPPDTTCPFTAEDVSAALNRTADRFDITVTGPHTSSLWNSASQLDTEFETDCYFGAGIPSAGMAYLPASTCTQEPPRNPAGLEYHASGLGVDTYRTTIDMGLLLLVCDADQPFAVFVNGLGDDIAAAVTLAGLVLNGPPTAGGVMGNHGEDRPPGARWR